MSNGAPLFPKRNPITRPVMADPHAPVYTTNTPITLAHGDAPPVFTERPSAPWMQAAAVPCIALYLPGGHPDPCLLCHGSGVISKDWLTIAYADLVKVVSSEQEASTLILSAGVYTLDEALSLSALGAYNESIPSCRIVVMPSLPEGHYGLYVESAQERLLANTHPWIQGVTFAVLDLIFQGFFSSLDRSAWAVIQERGNE